jgi:hypothetical protein
MELNANESECSAMGDIYAIHKLETEFPIMAALRRHAHRAMTSMKTRHHFHLNGGFHALLFIILSLQPMIH